MVSDRAGEFDDSTVRPMKSLDIVARSERIISLSGEQ